MQNKFNKLSTAKKSTRNLSCSSHTRRAKQIAHNFLAKAHSTRLKMDDFVDDVKANAGDGNERSLVKEKSKWRRTGALRVNWYKKKENESTSREREHNNFFNL